MSISVKPVAPISGEGSTKTLRQLHTEEADEERFQADLKKAVRQSLGNVRTAFTVRASYCYATLTGVVLGIGCLDTSQSYLVNLKELF